METLAYFIIGQQTETAADIQDSIDLAKRLDPNYVHFTIFCPYPGTAIYKEGLERAYQIAPDSTAAIFPMALLRLTEGRPEDALELRPEWISTSSSREIALSKCFKR